MACTASGSRQPVIPGTWHTGNGAETMGSIALPGMGHEAYSITRYGAERDLGLAKLGLVAGHDDVAQHRKLAAAAQCIPARDRWHGSFNKKHK